MVLINPSQFLENAFQTREDVERGCIALLDPLAQHTSKGGALISVGSTGAHYDLKAVALETFARPLWGLAALLSTKKDGYAGSERWVRGLANGTDPDSEEYWGAAKAKDQRMVEMSPLSFAIALNPDVFFHSQSDKAKKNIAAFLESCIGKPMPDTNWLWFRVFANCALRKIGSDLFNPDQMERDLKRLEEFQLPPHPATGDDPGSSGWSRDGPEGVMQLDYYSSSFAIQTSQLIYTVVAPEDTVRGNKYRERAQSFILDFMHYFDEDGAGIPFGRSMIYRFAIIATFSAMALADVEPPKGFEWGHIKGYVLRHFRWWTTQPEIFKSDGTLNVGYSGDNMNMTENYNSPGSPYWCMKAFLCLAAPASHPFWTSKELPKPSSLPAIRAIPDPYHIMCNRGGHTFLLSSGQYPHYAMRHGPAKYSKFSYSSSFGFSCPTGDMDLEQLAADSMLALRDASSGVEQCDGETWRVRRVTRDARIVGRGTPEVHLRSSWRPWSDVEVETFLIPPQEASPNYYLRVHKIKSSRPLQTSEAGWATYGQGADGRALYQAFSGEMSEGGAEEVGYARAATKGGCVGVRDLTVKGSKADRKGRLVQIDPNANVIFSRSILPSLLGEVAQGETWLVTAVFGAPTRVQDWQSQWDRVPEVPDYVFQ